MAILIEGMICPICGEPMTGDEDIVGFSPFVSNELDPLFFFNDGSFHKSCLDGHSLGKKARDRWDDVLTNTGLESRTCWVSGGKLSDHRDFIGWGFLTNDASSPAFKFNYARYSAKALSNSDELPRVLHALEVLRASEVWSGRGLDGLINRLRQLRDSSGSST